MAQPATLDTLKNILTYRDYPSEIIASPEGFPILAAGPWVYRSGPDVLDRSRGFFLAFSFQADALRVSGADLISHFDALQLYLELPFEVPQEKVRDILQLTALYNHLTPLGYFRLNQARTLCFRYQWPIYDRNVDGLLLLEIVDNCLFFVERLGYKFEELACGKKNLAQISQEASL